MKHYPLSIAIVVCLFVSCTSNQTKVDLIVTASKIYVCDDAFSVAESIAIHEGKIVAFGTKKEIQKKYSSTNATSFEGVIYPGFIDAHSHFYGYALTLSKVDLRNTYSMQDVLDKTVAFSQKSTEYWITGRGWDQTDWTQKGTVTNTMLNAYFPDRPIFIKRIDGHAGLANAKALEMANITAQTKVNGGEILTMGNNLTGVVTDNAMELIDKIIPEPRRETEISSLLQAQKNCFDAGLTTVTDAGLNLNTILLIDSLQKTGDLTIRVYAMCNPTTENFEYFAQNGAIHKDKLQVSSFKLYADGSLGSRGAKLKAPYCDQKDYSGIWVTNPTKLDSLCQLINELHFQVNTHAIGDSANKKVLEIYSKYLNGTNDKRWRIEHSQVVTPEDRPLFSSNSIIPSVQPTHATSDMPWVYNRLCSHRVDGAYAYKSLLALNGYLPLGTDFPVEEIYPLETFYAAVYRKNKQNKPVGGFLADEALSPKQALLGITAWAAKGNTMERRIGSLEPNKEADFVVLDTDILTEKYMLNSSVLATYLHGIKAR